MDDDLDLDYLMNCTLDELKQIDDREKSLLEMEQEEYRQACERVEMKKHQNNSLQQQLMDSLALLVGQVESHDMMMHSIGESMIGIQSTMARFDACVNENNRTIDEYKQQCELPEEAAALKARMDELQQQIVNRENVYEKILHCKELEQEIGERIQKQFYQKQIELENELHACEVKMHELRFTSINGNHGSGASHLHHD